jgi:hypothetical protein
MVTQLEDLKKRLARLEATDGRDSPYKQGLKAQIARLEKPRAENPMDNSQYLSAGMISPQATEETTPSSEMQSTGRDADLMAVCKENPGLTYEKAEAMAKAFGF